MNVLFVNHALQSCGIYQIGKRIAGFLVPSTRYNIRYIEAANAKDITDAIDSHQAKIVVYNYYPATLPFVNVQVTYPIRQRGIIQFGIVHDLMDPLSIWRMESIFDFWMIHDLTNPIVSRKKFTTCRPVPRFAAAPPPTGKLSFGSHGFGISPWKAFDQIVVAINHEFDEAIINMNIGLAGFGDKDGTVAVQWRELCHRKVTKPGIELNITHNFLETEEDMIRFLQKNMVNVYFLRNPPASNGPAGSADLAIASQRALVVNNGYMYRHLSTRLGACGINGTLKSMYQNEAKVAELYEEWSPERVRSDYEKMFDQTVK